MIKFNFFKKVVKSTIFFFTKSADSSNCSVQSTWQLLNTISDNQFIKVKHERGCLNFSELCLKNKIAKDSTKKTMVIAHGSLQHNSLVTEDGNLYHDWWTDISHIDVCVFHVCNGAHVLESPNWKGIFKSWVSYNAILYHVTQGSLKEYDKCWRNIFGEMISTIHDNNDTLTLKGNFKKIYEYFLLESEKMEIGQGREILKIHINRALDSLTYK